MAPDGRTGPEPGEVCRLTDDVLTEAPRAPTLRAYLREGVDRLVGADPGLNQLRTALQAVLGIAVAVGLVSLFVHLTHALQLSTSSAPAATVAVYNHALLIVAMLLGGMVAMMAGFTVTDSTARGQVISTLILPFPMLAAMAGGLALGPHRVASLVYLVLLLAVAVYVRRWGPRGFAAGLVGFNGGFLGFFLHTELNLSDLGWLAADLAIGVVASLLVRFVLLRPDPQRTLRRMRRSWEARSRRLLTLSAAVLGAQDERSRQALQRRLGRQVIRLNESTLMIDAQLAESEPSAAESQAQRLFRAEVALSNCARFATALSATGGEHELCEQSRLAVAAVLAAQWRAPVAQLRRAEGTTARTTGLAHRLAESLAEFAETRMLIDQAITDRTGEAASGEAASGEGQAAPLPAYVPAVALNAGFLPGSVPVSTEASTTPGRGGLLDRSAMPPYLRAAIQITVAATLAVVVGDLVSGQRLYWAVLATFLAFMATTNSGEQVRKALFRVAGTAVGIVVGDLLVRVTGGHVWSSLLIVLVALFFGIYLIRINYTFMVIGITVTMSQLYAQLGEFSWQLLLLRLGETAIGVGAVIVTVLVILPLRPQRVLTTGVLLWFRSLTELVDSSLNGLTGGDVVRLRPAVRELDAAYAALEATAAPLRSATYGRKSTQLSEIRAISAAARSYARSLAAQTEAAAGGGIGLTARLALADAAAQLRASMAEIEVRIETGGHGTYTRSAALIEVAARELPSGDDTVEDAATATAAEDALRDLTLLDGALARLAAALQMDIADHDTTTARLDVATNASAR